MERPFLQLRGVLLRRRAATATCCNGDVLQRVAMPSWREAVCSSSIAGAGVKKSRAVRGFSIHPFDPRYGLRGAPHHVVGTPRVDRSRRPYSAMLHCASRATWNPAKDCVTGMISKRLMFKCAGRLAT
ncbi:hypothetical protein BXO447_017380 [Xanthomonas oryzae pv. oryzae]|nr:hypothetical protein BXO447_017380 [Xanthomonas oryzae pv. oryzae]